MLLRRVKPFCPEFLFICKWNCSPFSQVGNGSPDQAKPWSRDRDQRPEGQSGYIWQKGLPTPQKIKIKNGQEISVYEMD